MSKISRRNFMKCADAAALAKLFYETTGDVQLSNNTVIVPVKKVTDVLKAEKVMA